MVNDFEDNFTVSGTAAVGAKYIPEFWNTITISGPGGPERDENMRGLYRIIVVNPKTEEISDPLMVIAKDEAGALVKAALQGAIRGKVEDLDILVDRLGDVRAKKDVQKVKVVKEDEES